MTNIEKKTKIKNLVKNMLIESHRKALENIDKAINSGVIDIDNWDEENAPMVLPKTILTAILENESVQYNGRGTVHEKRVKKEVKKIRYFL